ncbi:uncharacterized protein [Rutidosis leptorrhynchoides]|uniref:uncharacterized protein n=1 Tax=Rutidosis leptorrhynchoides TaxID=125765 RepID=UPI003A9901D4
MASLIDEKLLHNSFQSQETVRNNLIPKKIEIFAWRSLRKRIPTRVELDKKYIDLNSVRCPMCDDGLETVEHAILFCKCAMEVWTRVFQWWNLGAVSTISITEIFKDATPYSSSSGNSILWQAVKWVTGFGKKFSSSSMMLNEIQCKSFKWLTKRSKRCKFDWHQWFTQPSSCGFSSPRAGVG